VTICGRSKYFGIVIGPTPMTGPCSADMAGTVSDADKEFRM
jgi:hypothetical protein